MFIRNIHSGKSGTGFSQNQYHTVKDYPVKYYKTPLTKPFYKADYFNVTPLIYFNQMTNNVWATQGFNFICNEMHGQPISESSYSGELHDDLTSKGSALVTQQKYEYFEPGESIPVTTKFGRDVDWFHSGKEVDITMAGKAVQDDNTDFNLEFDAGAGFFFIAILPYLHAAPTCVKSQIGIYTHATTTVITYPAIVKKVTSYNEGSYHTVENVAFDKYTGKPVTTKSYDEFKGTYLVQTIPGSWEYKNLQPKALNEGMILEGFKYSIAGGNSYIEKTVDPCVIKDILIPGDLIEVGSGNLFHVKEYDEFNNRFLITRSQLSTNQTGPATGTISDIKILLSGRSNRLSENIGSYTLHSTDENISIPRFDQLDWKQGDKLISDLNSNIITRNLPTIPDSEGTFTLNNDNDPENAYQDVNMESLVSEIPDDCVDDIKKAAIRNVKFKYSKNSNNFQLKIISFEFKCKDGSWKTINGNQDSQ